MALPFIKPDARQQEAKYKHEVEKNEQKEIYGRKKENYKPSGYMTVEEYEELSKYTEEPAVIEKPKVDQSDLKYVPQPTYKVVRYNDPPGSPELNITKKFYQMRQYTGQGVTAPDYSMIAYPVVYYYPQTDSTASDIFIIPLKNEGSPINIIKNAKGSDRWDDPIISTVKSVDKSTAFHSLTPVDFSADAKYLLAKEKIGSSHDGIWKTNAIVYDFNTKTAYELVEIRDAIIYYWKENEKLNLDECRWDIYPLGFLQDEPDRVAVAAYGYTGEEPIFLGVWSIDVHGEQARLMTFKPSEVNFSINGFKLIQDGVVARTIVEREQKQLKKLDKKDRKAALRKEKRDLRAIDRELKAKLRDMNAEYREQAKDYRKLNSLRGSTSYNEIDEEYRQYKIKDL